MLVRLRSCFTLCSFAKRLTENLGGIMNFILRNLTVYELSPLPWLLAGWIVIPVLLVVLRPVMKLLAAINDFFLYQH